MRRNKKYLILGLLLCFCTTLINPIPAKATSATLYLAPGSGTYVIGSNFTVSVKVNTGGDDVNASEGKISFDNNLLDVVGLSKGGSIFPFWTAEPSFSNSAGTINFGGGLPPPAYSGTAGHIFSITFKAKNTGSARVSFSSGAVLANDGKGTNILASMGSANYTISPKVTAPSSDKPVSKPKEQKPAEPEYNKPIIISPTHPDQNSWYSLDQAKFEWDLPTSITGVSIVFNQKESSDPGPSSDGLFSEKEYEITESGIWYLHLKLKDSKRWGTIGQYKVMVDTVPPLPFEIDVTEVEVGELPELNFKTEDKESGIEKYEIYIDSLEKPIQENGPDENTLKLSGIQAGEHTAMIKAIDKAGNERMATVDFSVEAISAPVIVNYPSEIKAKDNFYMNGTAPENAKINIFILEKNKVIANSSTKSDSAGNWLYLHEEKLKNGRYVAWVEAINDKGIKSEPSNKVTFLVSPPVFAVIGDFVINYFTVFVSLLFLIILIILIIFLIIFFIRKKLKKETLEIEEALNRNAEDNKKAIEEELNNLAKAKTKAEHDTAKEETKKRLKTRVEDNKNKTLKEIRDVEEILK